MKKLKRLRQEKIRQRKNFFPSLLITLLLWLTTVAFILWVDPDVSLALPLLLTLLFFTLLFTCSIILGNTRRGLISSSIMIIFLVLRLWGVGHLINLLILLALGITTEIYFSRK